MADLTFKPRKHLQAKISLPPDKSILHRALILNALSEGEADITASEFGEDNKSTIQALKALGVSIELLETRLHIKGVGKQGFKAPKQAVDCGNSATTMRLLAGVLAAQDFNAMLTGDDSLLQRPMQRIITPLENMGADVTASNGRAPLLIKGKNLKAFDYTLPVASAQLKSSLLLAGLCSGQAISITEPAETRDHTERLLQAMKVPLEITQNKIKLPAYNDPIKALDIHVPGDFSAAAFYITAACLADRADLSIPAVNVNPTRTGLLRYLILMGAKIKMSNQQWYNHEPVADIHVKTVKKLNAVSVRSEHIPSLIDELPLLFLLAAKAQGTTVIPNVSELQYKECDRLNAMVDYLRTMGIAVMLEDDKISITGNGRLTGGTFDSWQDHRMTMTLAVASFMSDSPVHIKQADCFSVSFPNFLQALA